MKLMVCIANQRYGNQMTKHLSHKGYRVTKLASTGGFLREGNDTLLIGVANDDLERLQSEMKHAVEALDNEKGWDTEGNRYTSFILNGQNYLPLLQGKS